MVILRRTGFRSAVRAVVCVAAALAATISRGDKLVLHDLVEAVVGEVETSHALNALGGAALLLLELLLTLFRDFRFAQVAKIYEYIYMQCRQSR